MSTSLMLRNSRSHTAFSWTGDEITGLTSGVISGSDLITTTALSTTLMGYATTTALTTGLAGKQDSLTVPQINVINGRPFTQADETKLDNIEAQADVTDSANVEDALTAGTGILISNDSTSTISVQNPFTGADATKLDGIAIDRNHGDNIVADANGILTVPDVSGGQSGFMSPGQNTKLTGIATGADVTPSWVPDTDPEYLDYDDFNEDSTGSVVQSLSHPDGTGDKFFTTQRFGTVVEAGATWQNATNGATELPSNYDAVELFHNNDGRVWAGVRGGEPTPPNDNIELTLSALANPTNLTLSANGETIEFPLPSTTPHTAEFTLTVDSSAHGSNLASARISYHSLTGLAQPHSVSGGSTDPNHFWTTGSQDITIPDDSDTASTTMLLHVYQSTGSGGTPEQLTSGAWDFTSTVHVTLEDGTEATHNVTRRITFGHLQDLAWILSDTAPTSSATGATNVGELHDGLEFTVSNTGADDTRLYFFVPDGATGEQHDDVRFITQGGIFELDTTLVGADGTTGILDAGIIHPNQSFDLTVENA